MTKVKLYDILFAACFLAMGFFVQMAVFPAWGITAVAPRLVLPMIISVSLLCGPRAGGTAGLIVGIVWDAMFSPGLGFAALPLFVVGMVCFSLTKRFQTGNVVLPMLCTMVGYFFMDFFAWAIMYLMRQPASILGVVWLRMLMSASITTLFAVAIHWVFHKFYGRQARQRPQSWMWMG